MIKECKILYYNSFLKILVFDYDGKHIQISGTVHPDQETVYIKYENDKYKISNKEEYNFFLRTTRKKRSEKKNFKKTDEVLLHDESD